MWMTHPGVIGVVRVPDSSFTGGWDQLGWVSATAPLGAAPDPRWSVSEAEVAAMILAGGGGAPFTDTTLAGLVTSPASATRAALAGAYVARWKASTAYVAGDIAVNPAGNTVQAIAGFTSTSTYDPSKWTVVSGGSAAALSDATLAAMVATGATGINLSAAYAAKWQPNTAYTAGQFVLNPSGQIVSALANFTSGAVYAAGNWSAPAAGAVAAPLPLPPAPATTTDLPVMAAPTRTVNVTNRAGLIAAIADIRQGDKISCAAGNYGSSSADLTFVSPSIAGYTVSNPPPGVWIKGAAGLTSVIDRGALTSGYALHLDKANYMVVDGWKIQGGQKGVMADETSYARLINCDVGNVGHEAVHWRNYSRGNVTKACTIHHTGMDNEAYGEGFYAGQSVTNWDASFSRTAGAMDTSDYNTLENCTLYEIAAECADIKEGTTGTLILGNTMSGKAISGINSADSYVDVKGNDCRIENNVCTVPSLKLVHGMTTHILYAGFGSRNTFRNNSMVCGGQTAGAENSTNGGAQGINIQTSGSRGTATGNIVYSSNTATADPGGLTNVPVTTEADLSPATLAVAYVGPTPKTVYVSTTGLNSNTGATPATAFLTIGAAVASLSGYSGKVLVAAGLYPVTAPIPLNARQEIIGQSRSNTDGAWGIATGNTGVTVRAMPGFVGSYVFEHADAAVGVSWHWGKLESIGIDCNKGAGVNVGGVHIFEWGEEAVITRCDVVNAGKSGYLFTGAQAVGRMEYSSAWSCNEYGVKITGDTTLGQNAGSLLFHGCSGDWNSPGWLFHDGSAQITEISPKHEQLTDGQAGWTIAGTGTAGNRARLLLVGGRYDPIAAGTQSLVRITGTATPSVVVENMTTPNFDFIIDDLVKGRTVPVVGSQGPVLTVWAQDGNENIILDCKSMTLGSQLTAQGTAASGNPQLLLNNVQAGYAVKVASAYDADPVQVSLDDKTVWRASTAKHTWSTFVGTTRTDMLTLDKDALTLTGSTAGLPVAAVAYRGQVRRIDGAAGVLDRLVICRKDAANAYAWVDLY